MGFRTWVRASDLKEAGVADSLTQIDHLIRDHGFPPSRLLSPRIRARDLAEVEAWIDRRPVGKVEGHEYGVIKQQQNRRAKTK